VEVKRERLWDKEWEREREREKERGKERGWAASWNLSFLDPVFPSFGHSVAGKKMCCIFEVLDHVTKAGFVNQSTQWFQEERERERVYVSEGERERERERERKRETGKGEGGGMQQAELYRRCERELWLTNTTTTLLLSSFLLWLTLANHQTVRRSHPRSGKFAFHSLLKISSSL